MYAELNSKTMKDANALARALLASAATFPIDSTLSSGPWARIGDRVIEASWEWDDYEVARCRALDALLDALLATTEVC